MRAFSSSLGGHAGNLADAAKSRLNFSDPLVSWTRSIMGLLGQSIR